MNITKEEIKKFDPCSDGYQWYLDHGSPDLTKTLSDVNKVKPDWAAWLYTRLMTPKQQKQFAIYAAEQVLHIFEAEYRDDKRPRKAIEAAKRVLKSNTRDNREAARRAAYNARDAANAAFAAFAAYGGGGYAAFAAHAAGAAANANHAAGGSAATRAVGYGDMIAMREKLIRKAIKLLEEK